MGFWLAARVLEGLALPRVSGPVPVGLLEALRGGERTVGEVVEATGLSQPNASGHFACLRDCGLVTSRQDGRYIYYGFADDGLDDVLRGAETLLARAAERVYGCTRYER